MFSIIIPLFNKGALVKRAIDSVLLQLYQGFEIIIVDDGSTDDSSRYVVQYEDKRIRYYYKDNGGVSSARNYGFSKAIYDWIVFLDADDELLPNSLSSFKLMIEKNKCRFVIGKNYLIRGNSKDSFIIPQKQDSCFSFSKHPFFSLWCRRFYAAPRTMAIHKSLINTYGLFDQRMSFYEDYEFALRLLQCGSIVYTNNYTSIYYQDGDGLSASFHPIEKEMAYYIPEIIKKQKPDLWYKALLYENIEMEKAWWNQCGGQDKVAFFQDMQKKYFSRIYSLLHWVRQKMIRRGII